MKSSVLRRLVVGSVCLCACVVVGCSSASSPEKAPTVQVTVGSEPRGATSATASDPGAPAAGSAGAPGDARTGVAAGPAEPVGVKECDDYLGVMIRCAGNMDPAVKDAMLATMKQTADAYRAAASSGDAARSVVQQGCAAAFESIPADCK